MIQRGHGDEEVFQFAGGLQYHAHLPFFGYLGPGMRNFPGQKDIFPSVETVLCITYLKVIFPFNNIKDFILIMVNMQRGASAL
jgi:hypothetical protein